MSLSPILVRSLGTLCGVCLLLGSAAPSARAAPGAAGDTQVGPRVHIDVDARREVDVVLRARALDLHPRRWATAVSSSDEQVCQAPCDRVIARPEGASFYVTGDGLSRSAGFTLPPDGAVTLHVIPRRRVVVGLGWTMAALGGAATIGGATTMVAAGDDRRVLTAGGITLAIGLPIAIAGVLIARFVRTRVTLSRETR